jgi:Ca-activated chloride channel family protein
MKQLTAILGLALLVLVCGPASGAQAPEKTSAPARHPSGVPVFKVDVDVVLVEATVRDRHGSIVNGLKRDDFEILEDGVRQHIRYFSRDKLPLALALVIDRSSSIAAVLEELRQAAADTLPLLKPQDRVAMFTFADTPTLAVPLSTDRSAIVDEIPAILIGGGTDINDALVKAAQYLGSAAPNQQHVVILISDNEATSAGRHDEQQVVRTALETQTSIYSIEIGFQEHGRRLFHPLSENSFESVRKMARETGGEVVELRVAGSVESAMARIIAQLKQRYTLGYESTNKNKDGGFRKIEVRIAGPSRHWRNHYKIFTRRGYYAPRQQAAASPPVHP